MKWPDLGMACCFGSIAGTVCFWDGPFDEMACFWDGVIPWDHPTMAWPAIPRGHPKGSPKGSQEAISSWHGHLCCHPKGHPPVPGVIPQGPSHQAMGIPGGHPRGHPMGPSHHGMAIPGGHPMGPSQCGMAIPGAIPGPAQGPSQRPFQGESTHGIAIPGAIPRGIPGAISSFTCL